MFASKRCFDNGQPPSSKRARSDMSETRAFAGRCDMSATSCRQALQTSTDAAEQALDALLAHPELLQAYIRLGTGSYFYLTYALAHANDKKSLSVSSKCLQVLDKVLVLPGSPAALCTMGATSYITQAMRAFPQLTPCATALVDVISKGQDVVEQKPSWHQGHSYVQNGIPPSEHFQSYARTVSW